MVAPNGTAAFDFLELAGELNPCYIFSYKTFSIGRYITTICCVQENRNESYYWFIYLNGKLSPVGADLLKPKDGNTLLFEYRFWDSRNSNHTLPTTRKTKPTTRKTKPTTRKTKPTTRKTKPTATPSQLLDNTNPTGKGNQQAVLSLSIIFIMVVVANLGQK